MNKYRTEARCAAWALALLYLWWYVRWSVRPDHFFFADDWDWLYRAALLTLQEQFALLPRYAVNDRPVGALAVRVMYRVFGLNPAPFHWLGLVLHLLNVSLLLALARRLMRSWWAAAATSLAYGAWSAAIEAVTWMGAVFDVLGTTFVLAAVLTFNSRRWAVRLASVALYYLAVRTKEGEIVLPALLVAMVLACHPKSEWTTEAKRTLWPHCLLALVFAACYAPLLSEFQRGEPASNPYRMEFSFRTFGDGLFYYVSRLFYGGPWPVGRLIRWTVAMSFLAAGLAWRARATLVGVAGFAVFLAPVILMSHQRQALYLYTPAVFFVLALGGAVEAVAARLPRPEWRELAAAGAMLLCVVALPHRAHMRQRADWMLEHTSRAKRDLEAFRAHVPNLRPRARIALIGFPDDYHVFQTPGCSVLKVVYKVDPVSCEPAPDASGADAVVVWRKEGVEVTAGAK